MIVETRYEHIVLNENGQPDLTLGKIYSGLAYYADHQAAIDAAIEQDVARMDDLRLESDPSPLGLRTK